MSVGCLSVEVAEAGGQIGSAVVRFVVPTAVAEEEEEAMMLGYNSAGAVEDAV